MQIDCSLSVLTSTITSASCRNPKIAKFWSDVQNVPWDASEKKDPWLCTSAIQMSYVFSLEPIHNVSSCSPHVYPINSLWYPIFYGFFVDEFMRITMINSWYPIWLQEPTELWKWKKVKLAQLSEKVRSGQKRLKLQKKCAWVPIKTGQCPNRRTTDETTVHKSL